MVEVDILDEEEYIDRVDEKVPVRKVLVTYRVGNVTVDSFSIEHDKWFKGNQSAIIKQAMLERETAGVRKINV